MSAFLLPRQLDSAELVIASIVLDPAKLLELAGYNPEPFQRAFCADRSPTVFLLSARQVGKTVAAAALAVTEALVGGTVIVMAASREQASEMARRCRELLRCVPLPEGAIRSSALTHLELASGGRIRCVPATDAARGMSPTLVLIDEACFVPEEPVLAIRPSIASTGGRLVLTSSAGIKNSWPHRIWKGEENFEGHNWSLHEVPWDQTRLAERPDDMAALRAGLGSRWAQEMECQWRGKSGSLWTDQLIDGLSVNPLWHDDAPEDF